MAWQANDEARINDKVRLTKGRTFDFEISPIPSAFVIRISSFTLGTSLGITLQTAKST
jgi:hypothetical protein